ncbi:hypothetical protein GPECTOR_40g519 [Gonium pectorale]|uniref:Chlorophyllase n=1 Tax=Gonium pectorale TaxID=33097 RepID=A0A150GB26_GONPE|nr:hypothetical protein GPECTOR_40g519 [Gonium pectorale]|eukprot:KXZ46785.1 hypothetical protein GPECTOR_40g519 [Gonium pectorale]
MGPYPIVSLTQKVTIVPDGNTSSVNLDVNVTYPSNGPAPFPVLFMFNGFQARASWYGGIVRHVASWGYVVVQYTHTGLLPIVVDRVELGYLSPLLAWVGARGRADGSPLRGLPDTARLVVMGHSRGGKLAALHFAGRRDISAAVLLDPIDNTSMAPEGPDYPSAAKALAAANRTAAIVGSGVNGSCNPAGANYPKFFTAMAPGSWQMVVKQAGHMQYCRTGNPLLDWGFDKLCGKGRISAQEVITDAAAFAVAWLELSFRAKQAQSGLARFKGWVQSQVASGAVSFDVKEAPVTAPATSAGGRAASQVPRA